MAQLRAPRTAELILWRHGITAANLNGLIPGQLDMPLAQVGHVQARRAAEVLSEFEPWAVISSDLTRAADTAHHLAVRVGVSVELEPRLREAYLGSWQGLTRGAAQRAHPAEFAAWYDGEDVARGGGERAVDVAARATAAIHERLDSSLTPQRPVVAVTHAGTARAVICAFLRMPVGIWHRMVPMDNCAWSVLGRDHLGWQLHSHNVSSGKGD